MNAPFERKIITPAEREARKLFREAEASKAITENRERLKALRLTREAADAKAE
jgi:hypothetical protein